MTAQEGAACESSHGSVRAGRQEDGLRSWGGGIEMDKERYE